MAQELQLGYAPFSRNQELEADRFGLIWTAMAVIIHKKQLLFGKEWKSFSGSKSTRILSTHPSEGRRIDQLQKFMPEAMKYYKPMAKN
jgi:Zn-dependent protease with chaperone function